MLPLEEQQGLIELVERQDLSERLFRWNAPLILF
jgi:hypothetical protein